MKHDRNQYTNQDIQGSQFQQEQDNTFHLDNDDEVSKATPGYTNTEFVTQSQAPVQIEADSESHQKPKETEESKNKTGGKGYQFQLIQDDNDEYSQEDYSQTYQESTENKQEKLYKTQSNLEVTDNNAEDDKGAKSVINQANNLKPAQNDAEI